MKTYLKSVLVALIISVCTAALLIFAGAFILNMTGNPLAFADSTVIATVIISAFVGGIVSGRISGSGIFKAPLIFGGVYILLLFSLALIFSDCEKGVVYYMLVYLGTLLAVLLGAFISSGKKPKSSKNLKAYKKQKKLS